MAPYLIAFQPSVRVWSHSLADGKETLLIKAILGGMKIDLRRGGNFPFLPTTEAGGRVSSDHESTAAGGFTGPR